MSPRMTLSNWGSSSMLVRRSSLPTGVILASPSSLNTPSRPPSGGREPVRSLRTYSLCTSSGQPAYMVRNLQSTNGRRSRPSRIWRKRAGPGVVSRIVAATASNSGAARTRQGSATVRSSRRLARRAGAEMLLAAAGRSEGARASDSRNLMLLSLQHLDHRSADVFHLVIAHVREHRQGQHLVGAALGHRQGAA